MDEKMRINSSALSEKINILLVEDDPTHRMLCQCSLQAEGLDYSVEAVATGKEALERLKTASFFNLILLDHGLPDCTGLELLQQIKELSPQTPVVMITGQDNDEFAVTCLRMGASDYLAKTSNYYDLLPRVIQ